MLTVDLATLDSHALLAEYAGALREVSSLRPESVDRLEAAQGELLRRLAQ